MPNDLIIIDEPLIGYKIVLKNTDFTTLKSMVKSIESNHHPIVKERLYRQLLHWMYKNAILVIK